MSLERSFKPSESVPNQPYASDSSAGSALWDAVVDPQPLSASSRTTLAKVMALMASHPQADCILAIARHKVVGIATRQDLLGALVQHADWPRMRLSQVMTRPVVTTSPAAVEAIAPLLEIFQQHQITHLPVVDEHGQLVGLVNQMTLLQTLQRRGNEGQRSHHQRTQLFADVTLKIRQSLQLKEIVHTTVNEVRRLLKADRVLIYQVLPDSTGKTISEAVVAPYPSVLGMPFPEEVFPEDYQALYAQGRVRAIADVHSAEAGLSECLVEFVEQLGIQSKLIVPIVHPLNPDLADDAPIRKCLWGLLIAHQCRSPRQWSEFELDLMQQLAGQISLALSHGQLLDYLEKRVKRRTAELTQVNHSLQQEIQERKQIEVALRQSEAQLRLVTNNLPVLIAYVDHQQRYRFNNQVYDDWLGQSPAAIHGQPIERVMAAAYYQTVQPYVEAALAGEQVSYESDLAFKDGRLHAVSVAYIPHVETDGDGKAQVKG
ncbi:MAG: GAF domain-containing protein, partial [Phormidesmis sp.]